MSFEEKIITKLSEVVNASTTSNPSVDKTAYELLTVVQRQRADAIKHLIGDHATVIVTNLGRGENGWRKVHAKLVQIKFASYEQQQYYDALREALGLGTTTLISSEVISMVCQVRQEQKLPPYLVNLKANCEKDFFDSFIFEYVYETDIVDGNSKKRLVGYKPIVCLLPDVE